MFFLLYYNCMVESYVKMQICCPTIKDNLPIPLKNILICFNMTHFNIAWHYQELSDFFLVLPLDIVIISLFNHLFCVNIYLYFHDVFLKNLAHTRGSLRSQQEINLVLKKILSSVFSICFYSLNLLI